MAAGAVENTVKALERTISSGKEAHSDAVLRYHLPSESRLYENRPIVRNDWISLNLANCISQIVCVVTPEGRGQYFNPYWETYTGLSERQSLDLGWTRAYHNEDIDRFLELLRTPLEFNGREFEARLRRASDGSYRRHLCRCSIVTNQSDGLINLLIFCSDAEDWRKAEATAREQEALLGLTLRTHDEEKRKIAHGLHDNATQYLAALQMKLDGLQRCSIGNTDRKNPIVDECCELVKRCCREIRGMSHLLYPPLLDELGLESAVRLHLDGFMERTKAGVELEVEPNLGRLDRDLEIALFRVVQEASAMIHRQCASKNVHIRIGAGGSSIFVEVAGSGEPPEAKLASSQTPSGIGMATLRQRILGVGGLFEIGTRPDGVVVRAVVPRRALVAQACE
jgi:PAS domain S-box-containing protein